MLVTAVSWMAYVGPRLWREFFGGAPIRILALLELFSYLAIITTLAVSASVYLLARHGELVRSRRHRRAPRGVIDTAMRQRGERTLTILVPAYREEARIIRQTLLSAALQEYPGKNLVLLIDDPPIADSQRHADMLVAARAVPREIAALLEEPAAHFERALERFERDRECDAEAVIDCAGQYRLAVTYVESIAARLEIVDHTDEFVADHVLGALTRDMAQAEGALRDAGERGATLPEDILLQLYRRLAWTFRCELSSFERKRFVNLSHEPNKAMNLNSYLELMGNSYQVAGHGTATALVPCVAEEADLRVPNTDYVLTLDADSVLLPEYCLRLIHRMELPNFRDVAVIQTPYSSFPGSATRLERIAGATTDLQHLLHQGMTYYDATYWVGANAILRTRALQDIAEVDESGPWPVRRFISDRTVIEDTESSVDLVANGWRLHNYHERLSYSATPPDFGSLCIQRQRWANGGLLILPKLLRSLRRGDDPIGSLVRINYVTSIAWASIGLVLLLMAPYDDRFLSPLVLLITAPYFMAMASDLRRCGYKHSDVVRVYAFNLIMLPVNVAGTVKSIYQAVTGRKFAFARTPKVKDRTTAGFWFVVFPYLLIAWSCYTVYRDIEQSAYTHAVFAGLNAVMATYGLVAFIGVRWSLLDMVVRGVDLLRHTKSVNDDVRSNDAWEEVLFYGSEGSDRPARVRLPRQLALAEPQNVVSLEERSPTVPKPPEELPELVSHVPRSIQPVIDLTDRSSTVAEQPDPRHELLAAIHASRQLLEAMEQRLEQLEEPHTRDTTPPLDDAGMR